MKTIILFTSLIISQYLYADTYLCQGHIEAKDSTGESSKFNFHVALKTGLKTCHNDCSGRTPRYPYRWSGPSDLESIISREFNRCNRVCRDVTKALYLSGDFQTSELSSEYWLTMSSLLPKWNNFDNVKVAVEFNTNNPYWTFITATLIASEGSKKWTKSVTKLTNLSDVLKDAGEDYKAENAELREDFSPTLAVSCEKN